MTSTNTNLVQPEELHALADEMQHLNDTLPTMSLDAAIARGREIMDRVYEAIDRLEAEVREGKTSIKGQRKARTEFNRIMADIEEQRKREAALALVTAPHDSHSE